ncbi:hypothetical protein [Vibrio sp. S11_S32]|uniref:hypothetical protein n=1 Tax=Vibrio sp. S11_S32 TaxID=2720225 RepID=UPI001932D6D7|nr:hypothetical protein [Vibrio sp. S11_S32]
MTILTKKWFSLPIAGAITLLLAACSGSPSMTFPALTDSSVKTPGTIVWRDLATTNPEQVKPFYQHVLAGNLKPLTMITA